MLVRTISFGQFVKTGLPVIVVIGANAHVYVQRELGEIRVIAKNCGTRRDDFGRFFFVFRLRPAADDRYSNRGVCTRIRVVCKAHQERTIDIPTRRARDQFTKSQMPRAACVSVKKQRVLGTPFGHENPTNDLRTRENVKKNT